MRGRSDADRQKPRHVCCNLAGSAVLSTGNDYKAARAAAFEATFADFDDRYGARFRVAWHMCSDPDLDAEFLEKLAARLDGRRVSEIGRAVAPEEPSDWHDHERAAWLSALGSWAIGPLADRDRSGLVGIAYLLGLEAEARRWGIRI